MENEEINLDFYDILGVQTDCSQDEIKKAFRQKAKETHPDTNEGMEDEFKKIKLAYEILGDEAKRSQYDLDGSYDQTCPEDMIRAKATQLCIEYMDRILHQGGLSACSIDLIGRIKDLIDEDIPQIQSKIREAEKHIQIAEKLINRVVKKNQGETDEHNIFYSYFERGIKAFKETKKELNIMLESRIKAKDIIGEYVYVRDQNLHYQEKSVTPEQQEELGKIMYKFFGDNA